MLITCHLCIKFFYLSCVCEFLNRVNKFIYLFLVIIDQTIKILLCFVTFISANF